ncbi:MAG: phosphatidate cytidylyltransferase, partial [Endomicrobiia bacterium]
MLLPRIITSILAIPVVLISIYYGGGVFFCFLLIVLLYMVKEFVYMTKVAGYETSYFWSFIVSIFIFIAIILEPLQFNKFSLYLTSTIIAVLVFLIFLKEIIKQKPLGAIGRISIEFFSPMIFSFSLSHLYLLRDIKNYGMKLTYILFFTIWTTDNAA